jgi:hypothetical protein
VDSDITHTTTRQVRIELDSDAIEAARVAVKAMRRDLTEVLHLLTKIKEQAHTTPRSDSHDD